MFAPKIQFMWFLFAISFNINKVSGIPSLETQLIANSELPRYMYLQIVWTLTKVQLVQIPCQNYSSPSLSLQISDWKTC